MSSLREQLIRNEGGYQRYAYQDSLGLWTVGYGRCLDRARGKGISQAEADLLLDNDIRDTIAEIIVALPWWHFLNEPRKAVIVDMAFNLGVAGLLGFREMLAAAKAEDWEQAAYHILDSKYAKQVGARANRNAYQMKDGEWV